MSISHTFRDQVVLIQPSDRQYNNIHGLRNGNLKPLQTVRGGVWGLTGGSIGTAPIWRRPDDILSIVHTFRGHVVLIQPSDRRYNNIHGLCNGKTVTNRVRGGVR
jgi:hypothetical protein